MCRGDAEGGAGGGEVVVDREVVRVVKHQQLRVGRGGGEIRGHQGIYGRTKVYNKCVQRRYRSRCKGRKEDLGFGPEYSAASIRKMRPLQSCLDPSTHLEVMYPTCLAARPYKPCSQTLQALQTDPTSLEARPYTHLGDVVDPVVGHNHQVEVVG